MAWHGMQVLWRQLIEKSSSEATQAAASPSDIRNLFDLAATMPGHAIEQAKLFTIAPAGHIPGCTTSWVSFESIEGTDGATKMRFNAAEALGMLGCHWPPGKELRSWQST
jgi:hypothetical protein